MKIIETLATILTIIGFFMLSENVLLVGFATSLAANVLWLAWSYESKAWGIMVVNSALAVSSVNGILG
jgi:hypothetical protein